MFNDSKGKGCDLIHNQLLHTLFVIYSKVNNRQCLGKHLPEIFTHSVILGSMFPIHKRFPSCATLSEMMEAFSTAPAADDMCTLWEAKTNQVYNKKTKILHLCICGSMDTLGPWLIKMKTTDHKGFDCSYDQMMFKHRDSPLSVKCPVKLKYCT